MSTDRNVPILRDYQQECINAVIKQLHTSRRVLCSLPTGSGKTIIFSSLMKIVHDNQRSCLCIVQKNILVEQTKKQFERFIDDVAIYNAGLKKKNFGQVTVASIQSLIKAKDLPTFNMIIIDEVHRYGLTQEDSLTEEVLKKLSHERTIILGFSATPFGLERYFGKVAFKKTIKEMVDAGYLVPIRYQGQNNNTVIDISGVKKRGGDFIESQLQKAILKNKDKISDQLADALKKSEGRKKIIMLTTGIEHAEYIYSLLDEASIIHSKRKDNNQQLEKFMTSGKILVSVLIASEGFDFPEADCICMFRPTRSYILYMQAAGRVLRLSAGKTDGLFLDYGEIVDNLGDLYDAYDNAETDKKQKPSLDMCPWCGEYNKKTANKCSNCGKDTMIICPSCLGMTPRKDMVCIHCQKSRKVERDSIKNTTSSSWDCTDKWVKVSCVRILDYKSKAGNECWKVIYTIGLTKEVVEYVPKGKEYWYTKSYSVDFKDFCKRTSEVILKKEDKYWKIKQRR